jgi:hypothetical protein
MFLYSGPILYKIGQTCKNLTTLISSHILMPKDKIQLYCKNLALPQ